jgi:hypothetical protein
MNAKLFGVERVGPSALDRELEDSGEIEAARGCAASSRSICPDESVVGVPPPM